jgi:hypothetical protein
VLGPQGVVAEWKLLFNPRFLNIVGYLAWKHFGEDGIDLVLAPFERDSALAAVVADWLGADACAASERAWDRTGGSCSPLPTTRAREGRSSTCTCRGTRSRRAPGSLSRRV